MSVLASFWNHPAVLVLLGMLGSAAVALSAYLSSRRGDKIVEQAGIANTAGANLGRVLEGQDRLIGTLQKELDRVRTLQGEFEKRLDRVEKTSSDLRAKNDALEREIQVLYGAKDALEGEIRVLHVANAECQSENAKLTERLALLEEANGI